MIRDTTSRLCIKCGARIVAETPQGGCPACLLRTGLDLLREGEEEPSDLEWSPGDERLKHPVNMMGDFGDYELLAEIGRGGQGVVYRARQKSLNRIVALKVIGLGHWATETHLKRFRLEAAAAASLDHPCLVPIYEIGERDGYCYFSMKLVEGDRLDVTTKREPIPIRRAAEMISKLARTVHYAHERGIVHRDIKPGNILLDNEGEPHLTDFGLARLVESDSTVTRTSEALGTPSYMAPEQADGRTAEFGRATDVYGLGAVLYYLLTSQAPFSGKTTYETVRLVLENDPRSPRLWNSKVDHDLSTICLKCLEKEPARRYASALALAEDIEFWLEHKSIRARRTGILGRGKKWVQRNPTVTGLTAALIALGAALGVFVWKSDLVNPPPIAGIAVLPFENLSSNNGDAAFADGLQDDILTKLAKIADLKVISRTSVMQYRGPRNVREIGDALRVSHVLEGSVRKTENRVHLNAQLIDTRTDTHIWAEQYDLALDQVFIIQSKIAQTVAQQLHAKVSSLEKAAIERMPTTDFVAFDLYSRARNLLQTTSLHNSGRENLLQAADLLNEAVSHDPSFFQAYCELAHTHDRLYFLGYDHTAARLAMAETAIQAAFRLEPDSGEAHLARAENLYRGYLNYNGALNELKLAGQSLPNNAQVFELQGYIERRQNKQEASLRNLERAANLDPRNVLMLQQIEVSYKDLRRYAEAKAVLDRVLSIVPDDVETKIIRAGLELEWKGNAWPLHQVIDSLRASDPDMLRTVADGWLLCALAERDAVAAREALAALGDTPLSDDAVQLTRPFLEGVIARMVGDNNAARSAFIEARSLEEKIIASQPNYGPPLCVLGLIDAGLGRNAEAMEEGRRAVELLPVSKDSVNGPLMMEYAAMIAGWAGDKDFACKELAAALRPPSGIAYGLLRTLPMWDPLRGDPRFEAILASLAPGESAQKSAIKGFSNNSKANLVQYNDRGPERRSMEPNLKLQLIK